MSEQNNNCETCGNNKELDGSCFDCDHQRECGICYETKRWSCCDGGDFVEGMNCDHEVCFGCSLRITRCPFCRRPWIEDSSTEDEEEEDPYFDNSNSTDLFAELMARANTEGYYEEEDARVQAEHLAEFPDHHYCTECGCCIGCECCGCGREEQECRNCYRAEGNEWCTGVVTSFHTHGYCLGCYNHL